MCAISELGRWGDFIHNFEILGRIFLGIFFSFWPDRCSVMRCQLDREEGGCILFCYGVWYM